MKKNIFFLSIMLLSSVIAVSQIRPYQGGASSQQRTQRQYVPQVQTQSQTYAYQPQQRVALKNNTFATVEEARRAYQAGNFTYYQPSDLRASGNLPVDGITRILLALEQDAIVKMVVIGGILYVIIPKGSLCRFYKDANGCVSNVPYAFDMCGNAIYSLEYAFLNQQPTGYQSNLNNYSERPIGQYQQQYTQPNLYNCNDCNQTINRKGWTTTQKLLAIVGTAAISYAIYSISTKKNNNTAINNDNGNNNGDQTVITGGASFVPKSHSVGLSASVRF